MLKSASGRAAIVLSGSAIALVGAMLPAQAASSATTGWRAVAIVSAKGRETIMTGVDAVSGNDAWAAAYQATSNGKDQAGLVEHWAGRSWQPVKLPAKIAKFWSSAADDAVVGASSATDVWLVTALPGSRGSAYLRLAGRTWTTGTLPGGSLSGPSLLLVNSVVVLGKSGTWVFGGKANVLAAKPSFTPYAAYYNGRRWTTVNVPATGEVTAASAISASNIWAVTGTSSAASALTGAASPGSASEVLHWNGKTWQKVASQPSLPAGGNLTSITAGRQLLVGGDVATSSGGTAVQFTDTTSGAGWSAPVDLPRSGATAKSSNDLPYVVESLVPAGAGSYWALSGNLSLAPPMLWHYAGGKWSAVASPAFGNKHRALLQLSEVPGSASVWGVGAVGTVSTAKGLIALTGPTPR
jgi:hypothetical protein